LMGDPVASSETFTWIHSPTFRATPLDIKAEADLHFLQGVNQIVCHGWPYTAAGVADPGWSFYAAGVFDDKNPWFIVMPDLARYLQRVSFMMRQGTPANDVLLYLSNNDAWANFRLGHISLTDGVGVCLGPKIVGDILDSGRNLDFFDDELLAMRGKVEDGEIRFGDLRYNIVVLAGVERIPVATLQRLEEFARGGGLVVATRRLPAIAPGYLASDGDQKAVHDIVYRLFQAPNAPGVFVENEADLRDALNKRLTPDVEFSPASPEIGVVHRHTDVGEVYFLANTSNQPVHVRAAFRVSQEHAEWWNALTGEIAPAEIVGPSTVTLDLPPYGSTMLVWCDRRLRERPAGGAPEKIDLSDGWSVCFGDGGWTPLQTLRSWTDDDATRNFSGVATYKRTLHVSPEMLKHSQSIWLDFGTPKPVFEQGLRRVNSYSAALDAPVREAAVVYVNGKAVGSVFCAPYRIEIGAFLQPGDNDIRVNVANTALNELAASGFPNYDYRAIVAKYGDRFEPQDVQDVKPITSGLVGKIELIAIPRAGTP
ncbi:MAG TPA: glycosyl hydrolase, partial [Tepidisphaeraceae bacterium]|nr:glycosyl hydrolase [Tepidisphaeraceae bacterium]